VTGLAALGAAAVIPRSSLAAYFVAAIVAASIVVIGEAVFGAITLTIRHGNRFSSHLQEILGFSSVSTLAYAPVVAGLAFVYEEVSPWAVVLFVGPALAAQKFFLLYQEQMRTASQLSQVVEQLERVNLSFATALVTALDARDHYTAGHSAAVAVYSRDIAKAIGLSMNEQKQAHLCGLLHDIGKIGVPTGVLEKEGPLADEERSAIEAHAEVGAGILSRVEGYEEISLAVRHHHERFDGLGYPSGLKNQAIPILSRIVAVADTYSAMTSERPYREALSSVEARVRIEEAAGSQLDPRAVVAFVGLLETAGEAYARGTDADFAIEAGELFELEPSPALINAG
jgi:putative nucleotidyltransferase with HDIG domain